MFVGDIFDLKQTQLGKIDAVYDRAALVALPEKMRPLYSAHILSITQQAPQLLITFEYNQALMQGPPFSISELEVTKHFAEAFNTKCVDKLGVVGGLKGQVSAMECAWLLQH
jgi:thiopurine S-methyltransferase